MSGKKNANIWWTIKGIRYRVLMCRKFITFIDVTDEERFLTVSNEMTLKEVIKNQFFYMR